MIQLPEEFWEWCRQYLPYVIMALAPISIGLGVYRIYRSYKDKL